MAWVCAGLEVAAQGLTAVERQTLVGHRWWSAQELRSTGEIIEPPELADLLDRLPGALLAGA